jgi:LacI family transcriptional regulator
VAAECARLLSAGGTQMILTITENDPDRELHQIRELVASRIAGLVISPSSRMRPETRDALGAVPVVELHRSAGLGGSGVATDDEQAMVDAIAHLAALGHTDIGYVGTPQRLSNGAARLRGVHRGMAAAGLDPGATSFRLVEPTRDNGRSAATELLRGPATALLAGGGSLSLGVAEAAAASGRRVPDDLSLVVYGDPAWFALNTPALTLVEVDYAELARRAAGLLLAALESPGAAGTGPVLLPARLRVESSTAAPHGAPGATRPEVEGER